MQSNLNLTHWKILLGSIQNFREVDDYDRQHLIQRAFEYLNREFDDLTHREYRVRLYLAAHFSPKSALDYDISSTLARFELIDDYLTNEIGFDSENTEPLSRSIASLLDAWEKGRDGIVTSHRDRLLSEQNNRCNHCHISFSQTPKSVEVQDPYKPYLPKVSQRMSPEVDHIEPVSSWGTNNLENLQVICRLCNHGKGDGLGVNPSREINNSPKNISNLEWSYISKMMYYVLEKHDSHCSSCGTNRKELTIRPIVEKGGFIQSNLEPLCSDCAYD